MGDTLSYGPYGPYSAPMLNLLIQAKRPQGLALGGNPFNPAGVPGLAGGPSGAAVAPPGQPMPTPSQPSQSQLLADQATAYRAYATAQRQGLTTAQLNAQSLAAAQAGRNYYNPALNAGGNVTNALTMPPTTATAQLPAIPTAPPTNLYANLPQMRRPSPSMNPAAQYAMLNNQGIY